MVLAPYLPVLSPLRNSQSHPTSFAQHLRESPAPRALEKSCHEPFSEHLMRSRCRDCFAAEGCHTFPPFAKYLAQLNLEQRDALAHSAITPGVKPSPANAHPQPVQNSTAAAPPCLPRSTIELEILERVRLAYRIVPPSFRGAVLDMSA